MLACPRAADANLAQSVFDGEVSGVVAPSGTTAVRVDHEELAFLVDGGVAAVTATYQLTNQGASSESDDLAFAFLRREHDEGKASRATIEIDGKPVAFRAVTDPDVDGKWSALAARDRDKGIGLFVFHVDFPQGQSKTVTVHYDQTATRDEQPHVHSTFRFDYLLSPAKHWAGFGPLAVSVHVGPRTRFSSAFPFERHGDDYEARLPGLPDGELRFETTSLEGLWFGMTDPGDYWLILMCTVVTAVGAAGVATGRRCAARPGRRRALVAFLLGGLVATVAAASVIAALTELFPRRALGFGYGGVIGSVLLVLVSGPLGATVATVAARRAMRLARVAL